MAKSYALVVDGVVQNVALWEGPIPVLGHGAWVEVPEGTSVGVGCCYVDGAFALPAVEPAPTTVDDIRAALQTFMDQKAQALGYDSIMSAASYADEPAEPKFQAEGVAFRKWRSQVWATGYANLARVEAGELPMPTVEEAIAMLPELELPA